MSTIADGPSRARPAPVTPAGGSGSGNWYRTEDAWAIVLGVGLVAVAVLAFLNGASLKWLAGAPQRWSAPAEIGQQLSTNAARYGALYLLWITVFGLSTR